MEETLVFIDEGFVDKLTKFLGNDKRIKFDKFEFANRLASQQNLKCKHLFYYTCPPYQSNNPNEQEMSLKKGYDKFIRALSENKNITIRQGRCQKIINELGKIEYSQKGVDTLLTIDLSHIKEDFPTISRIILVSSDTDFCPIINDIRGRWNVQVILYSYFEKRRNSKFSVSNELIKCCSKFVKLTVQDFTSTPIKKI
jgi:uncharacterized LabA/DUF88 family protein